MLVILNINSLGRNIKVYVDDMLVKNLVKLSLKSSFSCMINLVDSNETLFLM